jgi:hypothetical protein
MQKVTYSGDTAEAKGNAWLHEISKTAPRRGGYDRTDVWVTLSNGQEYEFCFDVHFVSLPNNDTNIRRHMRNWFLCLCRPEELPHIAAKPKRLNYAATVNAEQKAMAESALALLDADPVAA